MGHHRMESQPKLNISEAEGSFEAPVGCLRSFMKIHIPFQTLLQHGPSLTQNSSLSVDRCWCCSEPVLGCSGNRVLGYSGTGFWGFWGQGAGTGDL